jgi:hypothetical protein
MQFPLAPVETPANNRAPLVLEAADVDAKGLEAPSTRAKGIAAVPALYDSVRFERTGEGDAETAREVVVARACLAEEIASRRFPERPRLGLRGDDRQRLDRIGDRRVAEAVVAVAAVLAGGQETALDEACEVLTRGRGCDPRTRSELARRQRPVVDDREHERGAGRLRQEGRGRGDVRFASHPAKSSE